MLVRCPSCSTAYEIPPPARPRRLRCARCDTEWRTEPPDAAETAAADTPVVAMATVEARTAVEALVAEDTAPPAPDIDPTTPVARASAPSAKIAHALRVPISMPHASAGTAWLLAWVASLAVIGGAVFAGWHGRVLIAHAWPPSLWLLRLLPGGVPV